MAPSTGSKLNYQEASSGLNPDNDVMPCIKPTAQGIQLKALLTQVALLATVGHVLTCQSTEL